MNFRELHACTRRTLKGRYVRVLRTALLYPCAWLFFKICPCIFAWVLIERNSLSPRELFLGSVPLWILFSALWAVLRFCVLLPLQCGTFSWFTTLTGLERANNSNVYFRNARQFLNAMRYFLTVRLLHVLALLPFALGVLGACIAFRQSIGLTDGGLPLFLTAQCLCIAFLGGAFYIYFLIGSAAVPFFYLEHPNASPLAAVRRSQNVMHGSRFQLAMLLSGYGAAALPIVTIPFLLPYVMTDYTLFLQIRIREWEQSEETYADTDLSYGTHRTMQA